MSDTPTTTYNKPLPSIDPGTERFWEALRQKELIYQRCRVCKREFSPYQPTCPSCWSADFEELKSSGRGTVYTYSTVYRAPTPEFRADLPYVVALIQLEEGFYMTSTIVGCPADEVRIDMPVEVEYFVATPEITLAKFHPIAGKS